ncbi:tetratricopeptide repeat protein [bacterium AH-315-F03]|nr:tetratricopeptide repeat protein [bacterium AH-315-F03]
MREIKRQLPIAFLALFFFCFANGVFGQPRGLALPPGYDDTPYEARYRQALDYYSRGVTAEHAGRKEDALRLFDRAMRYDPESNEIRYALANILVRLGDLERARKEALQIHPLDARTLRMLSALYERANISDSTLYYIRLLVEVDSTDNESLRKLAEYYNRKGQKDSAVVFFETLAERTRDYQTYAGIAALRYDMQDFHGALEAFERSVELNSSRENITSFSGIADIQGLLKMNAERRQSLQRLLELDSTYIPTHRRLMELFSRQGQFDSALIHSKIEVALQPRDQNAIRRLGILAFNADSLELSKEQFNLLLSVGDINVSSYFFLGRIFEAQEHYRYAIMNYRSAIRAADTLAEGWLGLASCYRALDSLNQSVRVYSDAINKVTNRRDRLRLYFSLGATYEQLEDFDNCERAFQNALAIDSMHAPTLNFLGYMLIERNERIPYAKEMIRRALIISPGNGAYIDSYAWALYQEGAYQEALDSLYQALESISGDPTVYDHIGDVYKQLQQLDSATIYWRRALDIDSSDTTIRNKLDD